MLANLGTVLAFSGHVESEGSTYNSMARGVSNVFGRMVALPLTIQHCQPMLAR